MAIPLILDCDNTMGVPGCDVDDGLALLYLLGSPEVELLGITCAYGNNDQTTVYHNTLRLLRLWGREDIPVLRGAAGPGDLDSDAALFIAGKASRYAGKLRLLVLGSTTNIRGAADFCPDFWNKIHSISFMGGLTEPLLVGGKPMEELNLSIDSRSSLEVLRAARNVTIATGHNCLSSFFQRSEFLDWADRRPGPLADFLRRELTPWYELNERDWNLDGIVNWDVMAAVQLLHPEYFEQKTVTISPDEESMRRGLLLADGVPLSVCLPEIRNRRAYVAHVYERYFSAKVFEEK